MLANKYDRVYTFRDGTKRYIEVKEGRTLQDELRKLAITESQIFQMQLVEKKA